MKILEKLIFQRETSCPATACWVTRSEISRHFLSEMLGQLTNLGYTQHLALGDQLRELYVNKYKVIMNFFSPLLNMIGKESDIFGGGLYEWMY